MNMDEGLKTLTEAMVNNQSPNMKIRLFTNTPTLSETTVIGDLTEASFGGYSAINFSSLTWPAPTMDGGGVCVCLSPEFVFTMTSIAGGPVTVNGIFVTIDPTSASPKLWAAWTLDTPFTFDAEGAEFKGKINLKSDEI